MQRIYPIYIINKNTPSVISAACEQDKQRKQNQSYHNLSIVIHNLSYKTDANDFHHRFLSTDYSEYL